MTIYNDKSITLELTGDEADEVYLVVESVCERWSELASNYPERSRAYKNAAEFRDRLAGVLVKIEGAQKGDVECVSADPKSELLSADVQVVNGRSLLRPVQ